MGCDCCTSPAETPHRANCPGCGTAGDAVSATTLHHQLRTPWQQHPGEGSYFFCNQPGCEVVYFNRHGARYSATELRQPVGQKSTDSERTICYCFDIRYSDLHHADQARQCRDFVIEETRHNRCACEQRNPSGRCCLRDFPKKEE